jgi:hypothetical protein
MSADSPPLLFVKQFGALRPSNTAAQAAVQAIDGEVRIEIKRTRGNQHRRSFYWVMLDVAAGALTDATGFFWDQQLLHDELKRRLGLGESFTTPSGSTVFKPRSTSDAKMTEDERAQWTDRCASVLSHWLKVPIVDLMNEVRSREAA